MREGMIFSVVSKDGQFKGFLIKSKYEFAVDSLKYLKEDRDDLKGTKVYTHGK